MLSQNESANDSRVIREATSLARAGHDVHVVSRSSVGSRETSEKQDAVVYHTVPRAAGRTPQSLRRLVRCHAGVLALDLLQGVRGRERHRRLVRGSRLAVLAGVALVGEPLVRLLGRSTVASGPTRALEARMAGTLQALGYLNDFAAACEQLVESLRPDVIHAHDLVTLSGAALVAARTGASLVYDAHELETHTNYHSLHPETKRWIAHYESVLVHRARVVTVCDSIADWLRDEYEIERPVVVMNVPDRRNILPMGATLRQTLGLDGATPLVVYVGSVTVDRGLELAVEALEHLPGVHLATVGWRYPETEHAMLMAAERLAVSDRLHLLDPVPSAGVIPFVSDADASLIPIQNVCLSYAFCFPNKLLESVFAGLPVAVADLVELRRFVDENAVGVVMDERDPKTIAAALSRLLADHDAVAPSPATIADIEDRYGWHVQEDRLHALYRSFVPAPVASSSPAPAAVVAGGRR